MTDVWRRTLFLGGILFSQMAQAHTCRSVLGASVEHIRTDGETHVDLLLNYLQQLTQVGVLRTDQIMGMLDHLVDGKVFNPLAGDDQKATSSAFQIHSDRIDEYLRSPIDQGELLLKLRDWWSQLKSETSTRQKSTEDTRYILAPVPLSLPPKFANLKLMDWHLPSDGFPLYTASEGGQTWVVDLQSQFQRKLTEQIVTWSALFRLRDGTSLVAFNGKANHVLIENVHTGKQVDDLDIPKLFHTADLGQPRNMVMEMDLNGSISLYMHRFSGSATWMAYNLTQKHPYLLGPPPEPFVASEPAGGQNLVMSSKYETHLKVLRVSEGHTEVVFDEDQADPLGSNVEIGSESTWDGRTLYYAFNQEQIRIFDPADPKPKMLNFPETFPHRYRLVGFYESKDKGIKPILRFAKTPESNWSLATLDESSTLRQCELPDSSDLYVGGAKAYLLHHYPKFFPVELLDDRRMLIGLSEETDNVQSEASAEKLYAVDLTKMEAQVIDVSTFDVGKLLGVQRLSDGRILGYFSRAQKLKILQILGPHDGKAFEEMLRH